VASRIKRLLGASIVAATVAVGFSSVALAAGADPDIIVQVPIIGVSITVTTPGGTIHIDVSNYCPGETISISLVTGNVTPVNGSTANCKTTHTTSHTSLMAKVVLVSSTHDVVPLGTTTADNAGNGSASFAVPAGTAPGTYSLVATGSQSGRTSVTSFTVTGASTAPGNSGSAGNPLPVVAAGGGSSGGSGSHPTGPVTAAAGGGLAFTGADIAALTAIGAVAIPLGALLMMSARRRRRTVTEAS